MKSYDHLNISGASVVQFRASRYIMPLNWTYEWKVKTIWIAQELPLFNSSVSTCDALESDLRVKSYNHMNMSRAYVVQFRASLYVMRLNRTSELKVMTIWFSQELPLFNFGRLDILCAWIWPPCENNDHLNFARASVVQFRASRYIMCLNRTSELKVMTIWLSRELSLFNFERLYMVCAWSDLRV